MQEPKARFSLMFMVCDHEHVIENTQPDILTEKVIKATWNMVSLFIEDMLKNAKVEADETKKRELATELLYRVILRSMTELKKMPVADDIIVLPKKKRKKND